MFGIDMNEFLRVLSVAIIPGLFAITLHEVAHGWVARRLGDSTAYMLGRLTLNPIKHIDPFGTIIVPIGLLAVSGGSMVFGWAKPVPVNARNLRNPKRDMVLVAAAGPVSNFIMATGWALVAAVLFAMGTAGAVAEFVVEMCRWGIIFNVLLGIFNLLPIPPLDGGRVLSGFLPARGSMILDRIEPFGFIILLSLLILAPGVLWGILEPIQLFFFDFYYSLIRAFN